ncbi:MAG: S8 family peptidase [Myxococcota bacterium]
MGAFYRTILVICLSLPAVAGALSQKPGSYLVKFRPNTTESVRQTIHEHAHAKRVRKYTHPAGLELVQIPASLTAKALEIYQKDTRVQFVELNYQMRATQELPDTPLFDVQWGLGPTGINAGPAWSQITGDKSVVIGILDSGVDYNHPDLRNNIWVNTLEIPNNGVDDDNNGYIDDVHGINGIEATGDPMDDNGHGTQIAGIIGAEKNPTMGVSGVVQKVSIIPCKFMNAEGVGDTASALACMDYFSELAVRKNSPVKIIATNNSWSRNRPSMAFKTAVQEHQRLGILFIASADSRKGNNDTFFVFPANATESSSIAVAASDRTGSLASFSNYGKHSVHVIAPGIDIYTTQLDGKYGFMSGTSASTAFVTGMVAALKSNNPDLTWIGIKNLIFAGGLPTASLDPYIFTSRRVRLIDTNGFGSLSCTNQTVAGRLSPKTANTTIRLGETLLLSWLSINCANPNPVGLPNIGLHDDGVDGDDAPNDGVYNKLFTPTEAGTYQIAFGQNDIITVNVVATTASQ